MSTVFWTGNCIGEDGVNAFKLAIQYQDTILAESPKSQGTGLMRLIINVSVLWYPKILRFLPSDSLMLCLRPNISWLYWKDSFCLQPNFYFLFLFSLYYDWYVKVLFTPHCEQFCIRILTWNNQLSFLVIWDMYHILVSYSISDGDWGSHPSILTHTSLLNPCIFILI